MFLTASRLDMYWLNVQTLCLSLCFLYVQDLCDNKHFWIWIWIWTQKFLPAHKYKKHDSLPLYLTNVSLGLLPSVWAKMQNVCSFLQLRNVFTKKKLRDPGPCLNIKTLFPKYGDSYVKDKTVGLIFNMGIPNILIRHLYFETPPWSWAGLTQT